MSLSDLFEGVNVPVYTTSVNRNANIAKLQAGYLFPEVRICSTAFEVSSLVSSGDECMLISIVVNYVISVESILVRVEQLQ